MGVATNMTLAVETQNGHIMIGIGSFLYLSAHGRTCENGGLEMLVLPNCMEDTRIKHRLSKNVWKIWALSLKFGCKLVSRTRRNSKDWETKEGAQYRA
eukprot:3776039-Amphidinium_carterae.1